MKSDKAERVVSCLIWGNAVCSGLDDSTKTWISEYLRITTLFYLFNSTCYFLFSNHSFLVHLLFLPEWQTQILTGQDIYKPLRVFFSVYIYACVQRVPLVWAHRSIWGIGKAVRLFIWTWPYWGLAERTQVWQLLNTAHYSLLPRPGPLICGAWQLDHLATH